MLHFRGHGHRDADACHLRRYCSHLFLVVVNVQFVPTMLVKELPLLLWQARRLLPPLSFNFHERLRLHASCNCSRRFLDIAVKI